MHRERIDTSHHSLIAGFSSGTAVHRLCLRPLRVSGAQVSLTTQLVFSLLGNAGLQADAVVTQITLLPRCESPNVCAASVLDNGAALLSLSFSGLIMTVTILERFVWQAH